MSIRTSQLQIRVTEAEKARLRRMAEAAGQTISAFVLSRAIPPQDGGLPALLAELPRSGGRQGEVLGRIAESIAALPGEEFDQAVRAGSGERLPPVLANQVAALFEHGARLRGLDAPAWARRVAPLRRPHFGWGLQSLRAHQLRVTPVAFKRRGLFFDPASSRSPPVLLGAGPRPGEPGADREALRRLSALARELVTLELECEFYVMGEAVLRQAFWARPATARPSAQLGPDSAIDDAATRAARGEGWSSDWLSEAVREGVGSEAGGWVEMPGLRAFAPRAEYVLAWMLAALADEPTGRRLEDLRFAYRAAGFTTPEQALESARRFLGERHVPEGTASRLRALHPSSPPPGVP